MSGADLLDTTMKASSCCASPIPKRLATTDTQQSCIQRFLWMSIAIQIVLLFGYGVLSSWETVTESSVHSTSDAQFYLVLRAWLIGLIWIAVKLAILAIPRFGTSKRITNIAVAVGGLAVVADVVVVVVLVVLSVEPVHLPIAVGILAPPSTILIFVTQNWHRQGLIRPRLQQFVEICWLAFIVLGSLGTWWIWQKDFYRRISSGGTEPFTWGYGTLIFLTTLTICAVREWGHGWCIAGLSLIHI